MSDPSVIRKGIFNIQCCVPKEWIDKEIKDFADESYPCGTTNGWFVVKEGDEVLGGDPVRVPCKEDIDNMVHVILNA